MENSPYRDIYYCNPAAGQTGECHREVEVDPNTTALLEAIRKSLEQSNEQQGGSKNE